jgi:hypothetical protein
MKKKRISVESLEKRCKDFANEQNQIRTQANLPPMSNSERLEMMALLAKSLESQYEIIEEEIKGEENGV